MPTIYPNDIKKYSGHVSGSTAHIKGKQRKFASKKEAEDFVKKENIRRGLAIKNVIHDNGKYLVVALTRGKSMKASKSHLHHIQDHIWCTAKNARYFPVTTINGRIVRYWNLVLDHKPGKITIDHINRDVLDNRKENLQKATKKEQAANRHQK